MLSTCDTTMQVAPVGYGYGSGGNGLFGGNDGALWLIVLFLFIFAGGFGGGRGFGGNSGGTMEGYVLTSDFANIERKLDGVNSGLCDGFYAVAQQFASLQNNVNQGFSGVNATINQTANNIERSISTLQAQIASCCCDLQRGLEGARGDIAYQGAETRNQIQAVGCGLQNTMNNNTRDIIDSQRGGVQAILEKLNAQEMAAKDAQIAAQNQQIFTYQLRASQEAQNNYLINQLRPCPTPAYLACNPWASQAAYGSCGTCNGY